MNHTLTGLHKGLNKPESIEEAFELYSLFHHLLKEKGEKINTSPDLREKNIKFSQHKSIPSELEGFEQLNHDEIKLLLMKEINLKFELIRRERKLENIIWEPNKNEWFESYRILDKLVYLNPNISKGRRKIQVYSKPVSISSSYKKHLANSRSSASKFYKGVNIEEIDLLSFNQGSGHLDTVQPDNILFLYLKFENEIGITKDNKPTRYVKTHIENCRHSKSYHQEIHSYPVDEKEIINKKMKELKRRIDKNIIKQSF